MAKKIIVQEGQSIFDLTLQEYGSMSAIFRLLLDNALTLDAELVAGQEILITRSDAGDIRIVESFRKKKYTLATADTGGGGTGDEDGVIIPPNPEGIGFWIIGEDFVVQQ